MVEQPDGAGIEGGQDQGEVLGPVLMLAAGQRQVKRRIQINTERARRWRSAAAPAPISAATRAASCTAAQVRPCRASSSASGFDERVRPASRCSAPTRGWPHCQDDAEAGRTTAITSWLSPLNMATSTLLLDSVVVLAVDRLFGHAEPLGDVLPRPAGAPCSCHLVGFELFGQSTQPGDGTQTRLRIRAVGLFDTDHGLTHACPHMLTCVRIVNSC
jgi:hypothetical protein